VIKLCLIALLALLVLLKASFRTSYTGRIVQNLFLPYVSAILRTALSFARDMTLINFPDLPEWAKTLATILPLSTLIEFIDVETKIHVFELRGGSIPHWNWLVPPAKARILLSDEATADDCFLDQPQRSRRLTCIDGRWGNEYPCSAPTTTRLWADIKDISKTIVNPFKENLGDPDSRKQELYIVQVREDETFGRDDKVAKAAPSQKLAAFFRKHSPRYIAVACTGWMCWAGLMVISFMGGLYVAASYLLLIPLTCIAVSYTLGTKPRKPVIRTKVEAHQRLIIAAGSENPSFWFAFEGYQTLLNGLLNISLSRLPSPTQSTTQSTTQSPTQSTTKSTTQSTTKSTTQSTTKSTTQSPIQSLTQSLTQRLHRLSRSALLSLLSLLILGQWAMALGSCALAGWDAFIISIWTIFCIVTSSYGYPVGVAAKDWLKRDCNVRVETIKTVLSSRHALLFALAVINPDSKRDQDTWMDPKWMDPIIKETSERQDMWTAVKNYSDGSTLSTDVELQKFWWWKFVVEGVNVGKEVEAALKSYPTTDPSAE
jgi:hypothetical protein